MAQQESAPNLETYPVWDLAVRVSHWGMATLFAWLALSGHFGWWPILHLWAGYALLALLLFRVTWGIWGSDSARFGAMLASLKSIGPTLRDLTSRHPGHAAGHNPIGALSVLLMLTLLLAQSLTGLFFESWGEVRGPLAERVGRDSVVVISDLHGLLFWPLLALVGIHVLAGLYHLVWKRENRLGAIFVHGRLRLPADPAVRRPSVLLALLSGLAAIAAVVLVAWWGPVA
jgi:cytochrome b